MINNPFPNPAINFLFFFLLNSQNCVSDSSNTIIHRWLHRLQFIVSCIIPEGLSLYVRWLCLVRRCIFHLRHVVDVQSICAKATGQRGREGIENGEWKWPSFIWEFVLGYIEWRCEYWTSENRIVSTILHSASGDDNSSRVFGLFWAVSYCGNYYYYYYNIDVIFMNFSFINNSNFDLFWSFLWQYLRGNFGDCVYSFIYLMEVSTPFVSIRSVLSTLGMKNSKAYVVNGLLMLVSFFICRILMWPYVYWWYSVIIQKPVIEVSTRDLQKKSMI